MSSISANLSLPYIQANQAQKHITHNESIRVLDSLTQLSVIGMDVAAPPATPAPGDRYIVAPNATGDWQDQDLTLAVWDENAWRFFAPHTGWTAWDQGTGAQVTFAGGAWTPTTPVAQPVAPLAPNFENLDGVGINTTSDPTNRLAVASDATLLTHAGTGHQIKVNKNAATDTASLLFQTGWSGRAEMGTAGSDDFEIKVSADGSNFHQAMVVDSGTGAVSFPNTTMAGQAFGDGDVLTVDYMAAKGTDLVTNGTGLLGNTYNMPADYIYDPLEAPNLPASFSYAGHYPGYREITEFLPVDPNKPYAFQCYLKQEALAGDWSAFAQGDRHQQYMGLACYDIDKTPISAAQHMRYAAAGTDSQTTLAAPLSPGDTEIHLTSAQGWNDTSNMTYHRGVILFGYKNSFGGSYNSYSRLVQFDLFDVSGVDKTTNIITLNKPFPTALSNPDDAGGTWPAGTSLANSSSGGTYKYSLLGGNVMATSGDWYHATSMMGGLDVSGKNVAANFSPGTAYVKIFWLPNYSNRTGGLRSFPDTGAGHRVWFTGISLVPASTAVTHPAANGSVGIKSLKMDYATGTISLQPATPTITPL